MKHNQSLITLALIAGAGVGAVQTVAGNPSAALTGRLAGEFLGAAVIYMKRGNKLRRWSETKGRYITAKGR